MLLISKPTRMLANHRIKLILGHPSLSSTERYLHGSQKQAWAEAQRVSMEIA
jgi:hypothetical protein